MAAGNIKHFVFDNAIVHEWELAGDSPSGSIRTFVLDKNSNWEIDAGDTVISAVGNHTSMRVVQNKPSVADKDIQNRLNSPLLKDHQFISSSLKKVAAVFPNEQWKESRTDDNKKVWIKDISSVIHGREILSLSVHDFNGDGMTDQFQYIDSIIPDRPRIFIIGAGTVTGIQTGKDGTVNGIGMQTVYSSPKSQTYKAHLRQFDTAKKPTGENTVPKGI